MPIHNTKALSEGKKPCFEVKSSGDYWRQAVFYQILAEAGLERGWVVNGTCFEFVEPDKGIGKFREDTIVAGELDVMFVKRQIAEVYEKIKNKEFSEGCGDPNCEWCGFVAHHAVCNQEGQNCTLTRD